MSKKITIPTRPQITPHADQWVGRSATSATVLTKRLTVDVPAETHARFKAFCALRKTKMNDEINAFIARRLTEANDARR